VKSITKALSDLDGLSQLAFESFCRHSDPSCDIKITGENRCDVIIVSRDELQSIMKIVAVDICLEIISRLQKQ